MSSISEEHPQKSLPSSEIFVLIQKAESVSEYRALFDQYWEKRKEEGAHPYGARMPGPEAQDLPKETPESFRRKAGRRQAEQGEGGRQ
jgi:hypothetical protein